MKKEKKQVSTPDGFYVGQWVFVICANNLVGVSGLHLKRARIVALTKKTCIVRIELIGGMTYEVHTWYLIRNRAILLCRVFDFCKMLTTQMEEIIDETEDEAEEKEK